MSAAKSREGKVAYMAQIDAYQVDGFRRYR